jgi:hypothetical protein
MKKKCAIRLLELQIEKIHNKNVSIDAWIYTTSLVLTKIFPISYSIKIAQIKTINDPQEFNDFTGKEKFDMARRKAEHFLKNYIEEIELLDIENKNEIFGDLAGSFVFWAILISAMVTSFIAGTLYNF